MDRDTVPMPDIEYREDIATEWNIDQKQIQDEDDWGDMDGLEAQHPTETIQATGTKVVRKDESPARRHSTSVTPVSSSNPGSKGSPVTFIENISFIQVWKNYQHSDKKLFDKQRYINHITHKLSLSHPHISDLLSEVLVLVSPDRVEPILQEIGYLGQTGGRLINVDSLYGYLIGLQTYHAWKHQEEIQSLKVFREGVLNDFKKSVGQLGSLLKTYGEGAETFKKNIDHLADYVSKTKYAPPAVELSVAQSVRTKYAYIKFDSVKGVLQDKSSLEINITLSKHVNPDIPQNYIDWWTYGNQLPEKTQRSILYRMRLEEIIMFFSGELLWKFTFPHLITRYLKQCGGRLIPALEYGWIDL
ncbi:MAG: hypothetical protein [Apis rhabdovirus 4]|uniref:Uncharacterized protein n=1 Tax=Apis rhabdovirus 4 TaxID=2873558 RepID=A0A8K1J668_9RHAB|nr:MAG: hypothetical protein [Apis rhabdovirus 4]